MPVNDPGVPGTGHLERKTLVSKLELDAVLAECERLRAERARITANYALAEERLRAALRRGENDWLFLFNLHPDVALKPEVRSALAAANLRVIRAALREADDE